MISWKTSLFLSFGNVKLAFKMRSLAASSKGCLVKQRMYKMQPSAQTSTPVPIG